MNTSKIIPRIFCLIFGLIAVATAIAAEKAPVKVRAGYVSPSTDNVLLPIAQKHGFLKQQGIEVEIIALRGGVQMAQALLSDSLQFAQMAGSVVVRAVSSGADLVMIAGFVNRISYFLVSRPEIRDVKGLAGKKIATASIGGSVDTVLRLGLSASGVDPKSLVFLSAGDPQNRLAALMSGQMDGTIVPPENLVAVEKAGLRVLKDLSEVNVYIQHTGLVVKRSLLRENRAMVKGFLAAIVEAINFYRIHEQESLEIVTKFTGIKDRQAVKHSYDFHRRLFPQPPYPSREGFNTLIAEIGDKPSTGSIASPEMFFDGTLLDELSRK
jgi:NitT/TauT family transport system substrate-binding protein